MKVKVSLKAKDLKNVAGHFKVSDPFAVLTRIPNEVGAPPVMIGKTEVINDCLSPDWNTEFIVNYEMGTPTRVAISIFDEILKKGKPNKAMGSAIFEIATVVATKGHTKAKELVNGGTIFIRCEHVEEESKERLILRLSGLNMTKKSSPFFELSKMVDGGSGTEWDKFYTSQPIEEKVVNRRWKEIVIDLSMIATKERVMNTPLLISVFDHQKSGKHKPMGITRTNINGLILTQSAISCTISLGPKTGLGDIEVNKAVVIGGDREDVHVSVDPTTPELKKKISGDMYVAPRKKPTFPEYLSGGLKMNFTVAIDFTGSNGDPRKPGTLHYRDPNGVIKNDYQKSIESLTRSFSHFSENDLYPVYGFGAKYGGILRNCFQCGPKAEAKGVDGIQEAYSTVFKSGLIMSKPSDICEVIQVASKFARSKQAEAKIFGKQSYTTLMILTAGAVANIQQTTQVLEKIADSPLSIVIVGIGNADFTAMSFLDEVGGNGNGRDIVQFIKFNDHKTDQHSFTAAALEELPAQVVAYFQSHGIDPASPITVEEEDIVIEKEEEEIDISLDVDDKGKFAVSINEAFVPPEY